MHYTPRSSPHHEGVLEAVQAAERYLQDVNESVRQHESLLRLGHFQERLLLPPTGTAMAIIPAESDDVSRPPAVHSCDLLCRAASLAYSTWWD